jgi:predicted nucleic acid-binding protein
MFVVDTNIVSEATRPRRSEAVVQWLQAQPKILLSTVSIIEIEYGIGRLPEAPRRRRLLEWYEGLLTAPGISVLPVDVAVARAAARLRNYSESVGRPRPVLDLIIAATAQISGAVIATRNVSDFEGLGIPLLNPFAGGPQ